MRFHTESVQVYAFYAFYSCAFYSPMPLMVNK